MTHISPRRPTFDDCNTNKLPRMHSECFEQFLDKQEVCTAIYKLGCVWLKEDKTYTKEEFEDAYVSYKRECNKPLFERLKNKKAKNV